MFIQMEFNLEFFFSSIVNRLTIDNNLSSILTLTLGYKKVALESIVMTNV